ncbi:hypothetical protein [Deinococcus sp. QL22]|uniref:hypothetical protein n=1 Tax=Deinococcus sp. QL22 TaxID=2939437 RepID=UPI00201709BD|nr:hypothetical protein [Deinococcus sp. QL22]UQN08809.1 hypothetical protein M1R55_19575 [Deinococcus sp. QL22]
MARRQDELQRRQTDTPTLVHDLQAVVQTHRLQQGELMAPKEARWGSDAAKLREELKDPLAQLQVEVRRQGAAQLTFSHDLQAQEQRLQRFFEAGLTLSQGRHEQDTARLQNELETVRKDLEQLLTSSKQHFTDQAAALGAVEKQAHATDHGLQRFLTWFSEAGAMIRMRGKP